MKDYRNRINIMVTDDIIEMITDFQKYMHNELCYDFNKSEAIRTMIFQRWAQIPDAYKTILKVQ